MVDYLEKYGTTPVRKLQQGGAAPMAPAPAQAPMAPEAPAEGGGGVEQMLAEYAQTRDPQLAVAIADTLVEMIAQQAGAAEGGQPGGEVPMARKGGKAPIFKRKKMVAKKC